MNNILISITITFIIVTGLVGLLKPQIHKPVRFSASNLGVENIQTEIVETKAPLIQDVELPVQEIQLKTEAQQPQIVDQKLQITPQNNQIKEINIQTTSQKPKQIEKQTQQTKNIIETKQNIVTNKPTSVILPESIKNIVNGTETKENNDKLIKQEPEKQIPQTIKQDSPSTKNEEPKIVLTEEEEVILWNKWRSDLQNQVMRDARVAAPMGTRFRFSFTVDKFGNISNLRCWSDTSYYTPMAVQNIKPVIQSYQGKNILKFPKGTKRVVTNVTGGFVISTYDKYSNPNDYSDVETIRRLKNVQM